MTIECFPEKGTLKVFLKQDRTDFVYDYRYTINDDQNLTAKLDTTEILVSKYFATRLQLSVGGKILTGRITKLEWNDSGMTAELEYHFKGRAKEFTVGNTILNGIREDPSNLVIFKYHESEEGVKFNLDVTKHVFKIK
jgi:hypothetical protein